MILCDREIECALNQGLIFIRPQPDPKHYSSTSIDLCLGETVDRWEFPLVDSAIGGEPHRFRPGLPNFSCSELERRYLKTIDITANGFVLPPDRSNNFILAYTRERIYLPHTSRLCARVEGKSSMARLGLGVHVTAPTIHAGFGHNPNDSNDHGAQLRLEIWNVGPLPIELVKGMRICQLIIEEVREVPKSGYSGQFNLQGPKPAQA